MLPPKDLLFGQVLSALDDTIVAAKGGEKMGAAERRSEILKILCRRRHETMANLASEFGVSERTIRRDVEIMSLSEPIYTQSGRYGGGVYVMESYTSSHLYLTKQEEALMQKLCRIAEAKERLDLSDEDFKILKQITNHYAKPIRKKEKSL